MSVPIPMRRVDPPVATVAPANGAQVNYGAVVFEGVVPAGVLGVWNSVWLFESVKLHGGVDASATIRVINERAGFGAASPSSVTITESQGSVLLPQPLEVEAGDYITVHVTVSGANARLWVDRCFAQATPGFLTIAEPVPMDPRIIEDLTPSTVQHAEAGETTYWHTRLGGIYNRATVYESFDGGPFTATAVLDLNVDSSYIQIPIPVPGSAVHGQTIDFYVEVNDGIDPVRTSSRRVLVTDLVDQTTPTSLAGTPGTTSIDLTWIDPTGTGNPLNAPYDLPPDFIDVEWQLPGGDWLDDAERINEAVPVGTKAYTLDELGGGTTYEIRVRGQWGVGHDATHGTPSEPITVTTDDSAIVAPTNTTPPTATASSTPVRPGTVITASGDEWDAGGAGSLDVEYRFVVDGGAAITDWTAADSYETVPGDVGDTIRVEARATNSAGTSPIVAAAETFTVQAAAQITITQDSTPTSATGAAGDIVSCTAAVANAAGWEMGQLWFDGLDLISEEWIGAFVQTDDPHALGLNAPIPAGFSGETIQLYPAWRKDDTTFLASACQVAVDGAASPAVFADGSSHSYSSGQTDPTLSLPAGASAGDTLIVGLVGQSLSVTSIADAGTQHVAPINHLDVVDGSSRDFELSIWSHTLDAGDITAGTIATVASGVRCAQLVAVSGGASVAVSPVTGVIANDYQTPSVIPTFAGSTVLSFAAKFNNPSSADMTPPANMTLSGTNLMGTVSRQASMAYIDRETADAFAPAIWDGGAAHSMMGATITVSPAGNATTPPPSSGSGWATQKPFILVGTTSYSVGSKAELDALAGTLNPGNLVVLDEGITITDSVLFDRGFGSMAGVDGAPILFAAAGISARPQIRHSISNRVPLRTEPANDYIEFLGLDVYSPGTGAVLLGGDHSSIRWCKVHVASSVTNPALRWLNPAVFSSTTTTIVAGEVTDSHVIGGDTYRGEGLYLGWGASVSDDGTILQRHTGFRSRRNVYEVAGGGGIDIKPGITDFVSENDVVLGHDGLSGCVNILAGWHQINSAERSSDPNILFDRLRVRCVGLVPGYTDGDAIRWAGTATVRRAILWGSPQAAIHFVSAEHAHVTLEDVVAFGNTAGLAVGGSPAGWSVTNVHCDSQGSRNVPGATAGLIAGDFVGPTSGLAVAAGEEAAVGDGAGTGLRFTGQAPYAIP